jgi:hypothetical protein
LGIDIDAFQVTTCSVAEWIEFMLLAVVRHSSLLSHAV